MAAARSAGSGLRYMLTSMERIYWDYRGLLMWAGD